MRLSNNKPSFDDSAALIEQLPQGDILVNNAGIFSPQPLVEIDDEEWFKFINVNFMSGVRLTRHYIPQMQQSGWGHIVFVSSESAIQVPPEMVPDQNVPLDEAGRIFIRNERSTSLLGRMASAEEVANLIVYLSSDLASATTGTAVRVDGGVLRGVI